MHYLEMETQCKHKDLLRHFEVKKGHWIGEEHTMNFQGFFKFFIFISVY